jgi:hypothetical protein
MNPISYQNLIEKKEFAAKKNIPLAVVELVLKKWGDEIGLTKIANYSFFNAELFMIALDKELQHNHSNKEKRKVNLHEKTKSQHNIIRKLQVICMSNLEFISQIFNEKEIIVILQWKLSENNENYKNYANSDLKESDESDSEKNEFNSPKTDS